MAQGDGYSKALTGMLFAPEGMREALATARGRVDAQKTSLRFRLMLGPARRNCCICRDAISGCAPAKTFSFPDAFRLEPVLCRPCQKRRSAPIIASSKPPLRKPPKDEQVC